jgi:crotonobetainyl-CoA:carnitine CoA-transferase CaiB-like acyl-CoA transferase
MNPALITQELTGKPLLRNGNDGQGSSPSGLFSCKDGEILIQAGKDPDFVKLCHVLGCEKLIEDERFCGRARRVENDTELMAIVGVEIATRGRIELYEALVATGIICGPVNRIDQAIEDPQVLANGIRQSAGHPQSANLHLAGSPIRYGQDVDPIRRPPPELGQHSAEVLRELLAMEDVERNGLVERGVIQLS